MPVSDEQREFWTTKNPAEEYDTITFSHPRFSDPIRLVANQFKEQVFAGDVYTPVAMRVTKPEQGKDPVSSLTLQFSRIQVGDEFKAVLNTLTPLDWMTPITVVYQQFNELERNKPSQHWKLFVSESGIAFTREAVQVKASDDNPMILNVSQIYTIESYPGLAFV